MRSTRDERERDLVAEIERAALGLGPCEFRADRFGDREQGLAAFDALRGAPPVAQRGQAVLLAMKVVLQAGKVVAQPLRRQMALRAAARLALAAFGEESVEQSRDAAPQDRLHRSPREASRRTS